MISLTTVLAYVMPIVAAVGVGGLILIYFAFPLAWAALMPIVYKIIEKIISCKICMIVIVAVSACVASWWLGHHQATTACREASQYAEQLARQADIAAEHNAVADEAKRINTIEDETNERKQRDAEYIKKLEAKPDCALTGDDIGDGWLRNHKLRLRKAKPAAAAN